MTLSVGALLFLFLGGIPLIVSDFSAVPAGGLIPNGTIYNFVRESYAELSAKVLFFIEKQATHLVK